MEPFQDGRARVVVVIPALDEEEALPLVLRDIPRPLADLVVVVDNGSTDRTAEVARAGGARVVYEPRRGYGRACQAGLEAAFEGRGGIAPLRDGDVVVFLDADRSDHPEEMPLVAGPVIAGEADLVIGSRTIDPRSRAALLPQARFGNRLACVLMRLLFGARHTDLGPFRAIRADALRHLRMHDDDYGWTVEMQLKARVAGLRVLEVPVRYRARIGASKITGTIAGTLGASRKILGWILGWRIALLFSPRRIPRFHGPARSGTR